MNEDLPNQTIRGVDKSGNQKHLKHLDPSKRGASEANPGTTSRHVDEVLQASFSRKGTIQELFESTDSQENRSETIEPAQGSPIPVGENVYIYRLDENEPEKLVLLGINNRFINSKAVNKSDNPYSEERIEVESTIYEQGEIVKDRFRYYVIPDGEGKLKSAPITLEK